MSQTQVIDYYQILGLQPEWDVDTIRKELRNKFIATKARVNAAVGEKQEQINQLLNRITKAKKILTDPDAKAKYDRELAEWKRQATPEELETAANLLTLEDIWRLIDQGRYIDAVEGSKKLVSSNPDDERVWEVYGYASYLWQDIQTAIYAAEEAIKRNPQRADLYADAAQYYAAAEQWEQSVLQLNRAISIEPSNLGYKLTLSQVYVQQEMWQDAEGILQGILSQDSSHQTARQFMAIVIGAKAEARFPEINALLEDNKKRQARKILKEVNEQFEQAKKIAGNDPELQDLLNSESIRVRMVLGVNFYYRLLGLIVDLILISPALLLMSIDNGSNPIALTFGIIIILGILGYSWVWLAYKNRGQDLTKRLLGMQIASDQETTPSLGQLITRAIVKPIAAGLGGFFPFLVFMFAAFQSFDDTGELSNFFGWMIGLMIGIFVLIFRLGFDLFFVTSKDLLPNFFGFFLFLHEHLSKTTVISSTQDDSMNLNEYHWY
ncbi:MAG: CDC27 family protein [Jaaginema sp. PMC 1079.18]|nr:CDC27 family protein [Jaaginema sp. PMC 1080.18]MEC4851863.1 CDC27 family protein [Jaaginema sp. PMC 1079.18]MEC4867683.1 CDC27 family protein [Jaaginema sp. PMC 1078.18]